MMAHCQQSKEQEAAFYLAEQRYEMAVQLYEDLYQQSHNRFYYQQLLSLYIELGHYQKALKIVDGQQRQFPHDLSLHVDRGRIYLAQGRQKKATKSFDQAVFSIGRDVQPVADLAQAFIAIGQLRYAASVYLAARSASGSGSLFFNELISVYSQQGDFEAVTNEYLYLIDHEPRLLSSVQVSLQRSLADAPDGRFAEGVRQALAARVREHPDSRIYLDMMLWFSLQQNDFQFALEQAQALDLRFPDLRSEPVLRVAKVAHQNHSWPEARRAYTYLLGKGTSCPYYYESRMGLLDVEFASLKAGGVPSAHAVRALKEQYQDALSEIGYTPQAVPIMRQYATFLAYHANELQPAIDLLDSILSMPRLHSKTRNEVKLDLGDLLLFVDRQWDASLLYMQVEKANKNDALGAMAKFKNAQLSYYHGEFPWALSQLRVLRASTSKLVANDAMELSLLIAGNMDDDSTFSTLSRFAHADCLLYRNILDSAWEAYSEVQRSAPSHPLSDEVLLRKAQICIKQHRYAEADSLLYELIATYPHELTADDALMTKAALNEDHLHNIPEAKQCYERLLLDYPSSLYADRARQRYNTLKTR